MKSIKFIINFKSKYILKNTVLPMNKLSLSILTKFLPKILILSFDKVSGIQGRLIIANNFIQFIFKMNKNHGSTFTIKWLKACTVSLQKWLGDDKVGSLRDLEPNLPLPRVINGCPAIINRQDRSLMRSGNISIIRFWHSLFSIYRVLSIPGKLKLETITAPFNGDLVKLDIMKDQGFKTPWPAFIAKVSTMQNLAPTTFHFSGKASPSSVNSSKGILADLYLLLASEKGGPVFSNLLNYLNVIQQRWNTQQFLTRLNDGRQIIESLPEDAFTLKTSMVSEFGQLAMKHEPAGKIRVFALVDSITQSVMKPIHLGLFNILRVLPNDGTFDQDSAVQRCSQKAVKYAKAYSFDLSAATDRLPVVLTASILESLFKIPGLGLAWQTVMVDRDFTFNKVATNPTEIEGKTFRYSVGQPMGCLSSWAGLAITHHWVMQYCSFLISNNWDWEDRYEVLGDDIVIFDTDLANQYLIIMKDLGVEINLSKSISSPNKPVFEFAKRTVIGNDLVSGITYSQVNSNVSLANRINNVYNWIRLGYLDNLTTISTVLNNFNTRFSLKDFSLMACSFSLLGLCKNIEHSIIMKSLVDPRKGVLWDMETENFSVPTRTLLSLARKHILNLDDLEIALSKDDAREEWLEESEHLIVAGVLQEALYKIRTLSKNYLEEVGSWSRSLVPGVTDLLLLSQVEGFLLDSIIDNTNSKIIDPFEVEDIVEKRLVYHAKTQKVSLTEAYELLHKVESLCFKYKAPEKTTLATTNRLGNNNLKDMSRPFFMKGPQYWNVISPNMV